jgi:isopentenyldiphosphate isomerase
LLLGAILRVENVCAGSVPPGWVKINDAWNPTVCGSPSTLTYNVWTIQQLSDQPVGASIYACKGSVPPGWAMVDTTWNPTVCGHPVTKQSNVMAIKRLD